jgi:hypothetical protein
VDVGERLGRGGVWLGEAEEETLAVAPTGLQVTPPPTPAHMAPVEAEGVGVRVVPLFSPPGGDGVPVMLREGQREGESVGVPEKDRSGVGVGEGKGLGEAEREREGEGDVEGEVAIRGEGEGMVEVEGDVEGEEECEGEEVALGEIEEEVLVLLQALPL